MKKAFSTIIILLLAFAMCLSISACSGNNIDEAENDETDTAYDPADYVELCDYKSIEISDDEVEVSEADLMDYIQEQFDEYTSTEEITDRGVRSGDTVSLNISGYDNGEQVESLKTYYYAITVGEGTLGAEFEKNLKGMMTGETKTFEITYDENYPSETIAGKTIIYEVKVNYILKETVYEITDENVELLSGGAYTTVDEIREAAAAYLLENDFDTYRQESLLRKIVSSCNIKGYPENQLAVYENEMYSQYMAEAGNEDVEEYLIEAYGMNMDDLIDYVEAYCKSVLNEEMVYTLIAREEGIAVTDEEIESYAESYAESYEENYGSAITAEEFIESLGKEKIRQALLIKKTKEQLCELYV